jgi:phage repressor protein C with HTH and peptisase S24 domain
MLTKGDSMDPTIKEDALIMVDKNTHKNTNGIYVLRFNGELLVKRLQFTMSNTIKVISDNKAYSTEEINPEQLTGTDLEIIGRVVWSRQRMYKKSFESMFIIDANEKPAPSFLAAYILTWLIVHNQVFTSFFKSEKGKDTTLYDRVNSAILSVPPEEHHWIWVGVLTFFVVFARFTFNNLIYMFREGIDNKSQGWLKKQGLKSPVSAAIHQQTLDDLAKFKAESHSLYDRTKKAEKDEIDAINKLGEFEESAQTEHYALQQTIDKYKKTLEEQATNNNTLKLKNKELNGQLNISKEELRQSSSAHEELIEKHGTLMEDHNELNSNFKILETKHGKLTLQLTSIDTESQAKQTIIDKYIDEVKTTNQIATKWKNNYFSVKNKVDIWSKNTNVNELTLLYKNDKEFTKSDEEVFRQLITKKIDLPKESIGLGSLINNPAPLTDAGLSHLKNYQFRKSPFTLEKPVPPAGLGDLISKTKDDK